MLADVISGCIAHSPTDSAVGASGVVTYRDHSICNTVGVINEECQSIATFIWKRRNVQVGVISSDYYHLSHAISWVGTYKALINDHGTLRKVKIYCSSWLYLIGHV